MYVCMYVCMYVYIHTYIYTYTYIYMYICMCIYIPGSSTTLRISGRNVNSGNVTNRAEFGKWAEVEIEGVLALFQWIAGHISDLGSTS